jgi:arylsulfatase A-like enzyme
MFAIRDGDWKLILGNGSGGRQLPKGKRFERPWSLYNMKEDLSETEDRYNHNPSKAKALELEALKLIANNRSR